MADVHSSTVHDHWWPRPGWYPGRLTCTWHLTFEAAPTLHRLVQTYQDALRPLPGIPPIPARWLHLSVQSVGFADEISAGQLAASTSAVRDHLADLRPFEVTFHRPRVLREGVVLPAEPTAPLHTLYGRIRDALTAALGPGAVPTSPEQAEGFFPHVTVGYSVVDAAAQPYIAALGAVDPEPAAVTVASVALIRQERLLAPDWFYRWTPVDTAPLAG